MAIIIIHNGIEGGGKCTGAMEDGLRTTVKGHRWKEWNECFVVSLNESARTLQNRERGGDTLASPMNRFFNIQPLGGMDGGIFGDSTTAAAVAAALFFIGFGLSGALGTDEDEDEV
jgi:hypothetical protein